MSARTCFLVLALTACMASSAPATAQTFAQFRLGGFFPTANSAFWEHNVLDGEDFVSVAGGASVVHGFAEHWAVGFNLDASEKTVTLRQGHAAFFPVFSDSTLLRVPIMLDLRFVPGGFYSGTGSGPVMHLRRKPAFYLGGGVGGLYWEYEEIGDFVAAERDSSIIYFDRLFDDGIAFAAHAVAGLDVPLSQEFGLLIEARYLWAEDKLGRDFAGHGDFDLSGTSVFGGVSWQF